MLQPLQEFKTFLLNRFTPCVYYIISNEAVAANPQIYYRVLKEWANVMSTYRNNIRIVFAYARPTIDYVKGELQHIKSYNPNYVPYDFLKQKIYRPVPEELLTTKLLRQRLLELDFLPTCFFTDLPIAILEIVVGDEKIPLILEKFPQWARSYIYQTPVHEIKKMPNYENFGADLVSFYETVVTRLPRLFAEAEGAYMTKYAKKSSMRLFFKNEQETTELILTLKRMADCRMMQQRFSDAADILRKVIEYKHPNFLSWEATFLYALCIYLQNQNENIEPILLQSLSELDGVINTGNPYLYHRSAEVFLIIHLIRSTLQTKNPVGSISKLMLTLRDSQEFSVFTPYLMEQSSKYFTLKKSSLISMLAGQRYLNLGAKEHALRCLYLSLLNISNNDNVFQKTAETVINLILELDQPCDLAWIVECLINSETFVKFENLEQFFDKHKPKSLVHGRFIRPIVVDSKCKGFAFSVPNNFTGFWIKKCKKVFDLYNGFDAFEIIKDCGVGMPIVLTVNFRVNIDLILENCKLVFEDEKDGTGKPVNINLKENSKFTLEITPIRSGKLKVIGVEYEIYGVKCFTSFSDAAFEIHAYDKYPKLSIKYNDDIDLTKIKKRDIFVIDALITNEGDDLQHLSYHSFGDADFRLVEPYEDDYTGYKFLKRLKNKESYRVRIAIKAKNGNQKFGAIFPYWCQEGPPRYLSISFNFSSTKREKLFVEQRNCVSQVNLSSIGGKPLFFDSSMINCVSHTNIAEDSASFSQVVVIGEKEEKSTLPDFLEIFKLNNPLALWYLHDKYFYSFKSIRDMFAPIIIKVRRIGGDKYVADITNIGYFTIHMMKISFLDPDENVTFIVCGLERKIITEMQPNTTISFSFSMTFFGQCKARKPKVMLASDEFLAISDLPF